LWTQRGLRLDDALRRLEAILGPIREPLLETLVVVHGDLHRENVRVTGTGIAILDWAFAHLDSRVADLGIAFRLWGESFAELLRGYEAVSPLSAQERSAIPVLAAARGLDHLADRLTRWAAAGGGDPSSEVDAELPDLERRLQSLQDAELDGV